MEIYGTKCLEKDRHPQAERTYILKVTIYVAGTVFLNVTLSDTLYTLY